MSNCLSEALFSAISEACPIQTPSVLDQVSRVKSIVDEPTVLKFRFGFGLCSYISLYKKFRIFRPDRTMPVVSQDLPQKTERNSC